MGDVVREGEHVPAPGEEDAHDPRRGVRHRCGDLRRSGLPGEVECRRPAPRPGAGVASGPAAQPGRDRGPG